MIWWIVLAVLVGVLVRDMAKLQANCRCSCLEFEGDDEDCPWHGGGA